MGVLSAESVWKRHVIDGSSRGADGVKLADVNGDGLLDVTTGWEEGATVRLYLHPGKAKVRQPWPKVTVGSVCQPEDAVAADLDGDGFIDVVSACEEGERTGIFVHWAPADKRRLLEESAWTTAHFPAPATDRRWLYAMPMDVDGRGGIDIVAGGKASAPKHRFPKEQQAWVGWFASPLKGDRRNLANWTWHPMSEAGWVMSLEQIDMDGDGDRDILLSDRRAALRGTRWLQNPGNGSDAQRQPWKSHWVGGQDLEAMFLDVVDFDGDGLQDVITAYKPRRILIHRRLDASGDRWATEALEIPSTAGTVKAVRAIDVNKDGRMDLVFTCEQSEQGSGVMWLSRRTDGTGWDAHDISGTPGKQTGIKFDRIELLDLDNDGDLDLMTTEERTPLGVIWYENPGAGSVAH
jgi:hypothetical protein